MSQSAKWEGSKRLYIITDNCGKSHLQNIFLCLNLQLCWAGLMVIIGTQSMLLARNEFPRDI